MASPARSRLILLVPVLAAAAVTVLAGRPGLGVEEPERPDTAPRTPEPRTARLAGPPVTGDRVVERPEAADEETIETPRPEDRRVLAGRVLWSDGAPFGPGLVLVHRLPDHDGPPRGGPLRIFSSRGYRYRWTATGDGRPDHGEAMPLDADGRFRLEGLPRGLYSVRVDRWTRIRKSDHGTRRQAGTVARVEARAGREDLRLVVPVSGRITVRVLGPAGEPVSSGQVRVVSWARRGGFADLDILRGIARCVWDEKNRTVFVEVRNARTSDGGALGHRWVGPLDVRGGGVFVRLDPARRLSGRVVDENGTAVPRIPVSLWARCETPARMLLGAQLAAGRTDRDGRFAFTGLGTAPYRIDVRPPGRVFASAKLWIHERDSDVVVRLESPTFVVVRVVDEAGAPVASARVWVSGSADVGGITDARGLASIGVVGSRSTRSLSICPPSGRWNLHGRRILDWSARETTVVFERR